MARHNITTNRSITTTTTTKKKMEKKNLKWLNTNEPASARMWEAWRRRWKNNNNNTRIPYYNNNNESITIVVDTNALACCCCCCRCCCRCRRLRFENNGWKQQNYGNIHGHLWKLINQSNGNGVLCVSVCSRANALLHSIPFEENV